MLADPTGSQLEHLISNCNNGGTRRTDPALLFHALDDSLSEWDAVQLRELLLKSGEEYDASLAPFMLRIRVLAV